MGAEIARDCEECRKHQPPINRPKIKSYLATTFNETVQHDLFFINNEDMFSRGVPETRRRLTNAVGRVLKTVRSRFVTIKQLTASAVPADLHNMKWAASRNKNSDVSQGV